MLIYVDPCDSKLIHVMNAINRWLIRSLVGLSIQSEIPNPHPQSSLSAFRLDIYIYIYICMFRATNFNPVVYKTCKHHGSATFRGALKWNRDAINRVSNLDAIPWSAIASCHQHFQKTQCCIGESHAWNRVIEKVSAHPLTSTSCSFIIHVNIIH